MIIVAEIGAAHNGNLTRALNTVRAAAKAGADAIKIQTWTPDTMEAGRSVLDSGPWKGHALRDLYRSAHTPWDWHETIIEVARAAGLEWWSTPFDAGSVDFLESLDCPRYKIASFEIVDLGLIRRVARTGKPIIISTGMATLQEIDQAVEAAHRAKSITLLRCVSGYPASPEDFNLAAMADMARRYECEIGLSDHTLNSTVAVTAAVMGASMIERHLTLSRADGLDDGFASEPADFEAMASEVKTAVAAIGQIKYGPTPSEASSLALRRSLWVVEPVKAGDILTDRHIQTRRPADGLPPNRLPDLLGKRARRDIEAGTPMTWDLAA